MTQLGVETVVLDVDVDDPDSVTEALDHSAAHAFVLAMHGPEGGSGQIQSALSAAGLPYLGPSAAVTALAFDKVASRTLLAHHNVPVPRTLPLGQLHCPRDQELSQLGAPCILKPRRGAHGAGVRLLRSTREVRDAVQEALAVDHELVLEPMHDGIDVQVVFLGGQLLGSMQVERGLELRPSASGRAFEAMLCPPQLSSTRLDGVVALARRAVDVLDLRPHLCRVDLLVSERRNEIVLEVEPLPALHRDGVVARVARAAGISYEQLLCDALRAVPLAPPSLRATPVHAFPSSPLTL